MLELTKDHNGRNLGEITRIEQAGGFVEKGLVNYEIEVSRAIGDISPMTGEKIVGLTAVRSKHPYNPSKLTSQPPLLEPALAQS